MLVLHSAALRQLEAAIISATHSLVTTGGDRAMISTIDSRSIKQAALIAVQIAAGEVIWPGDERLRIQAPRPQPGMVEIIQG